jgi:hypothetical protein
MPETDILDLTSQDVTQATWDELTRAMLDGDEAHSADNSCYAPSSGAIYCVSCSCGGGCVHVDD